MKRHLFTVILLTLLSGLPIVWAQDPQLAPSATPANGTTEQVDDGEELPTAPLTDKEVKKAKAQDAKASYPKAEPKISASGPARLELKKNSIELPAATTSRVHKNTSRIDEDEMADILNSGIKSGSWTEARIEKSRQEITADMKKVGVAVAKHCDRYTDGKVDPVWWEARIALISVFLLFIAFIALLFSLRRERGVVMRRVRP